MMKPSTTQAQNATREISSVGECAGRPVGHVGGLIAGEALVEPRGREDAAQNNCSSAPMAVSTTTATNSASSPGRKLASFTVRGASIQQVRIDC